MRKVASVTLEDRPKSCRGRLTAFVVLSLVLILSPVFYEAARLCYASWQGLFGAYPHVQTPVLDLLTGGYETTSHDLKQMFSGVFRRTPWNPSYVLTFALIWTSVLALLLRKN
ncbi:hypothetical protein SAMN05444166_7101 [Singulisphaera sp. GP187]|uniref:hypothetical protein n=1 Tax=Singulisphaera sp. GP187 TaxID=1882752 RepID=UPI000927B217|nr:hypothetical protein [Singulisphaera sp. GP187]SIO62622.1 hypothetical protein SAMN05444166_7101 [Singulisphaera sp. GP187]